MENEKDLTQETAEDIITEVSESVTEVAGDKTPEDTISDDPRDKIIKQQNSTIDALMKRTDQLTAQINKLLEMGVQITDNKQPEPVSLNELPDDYVSLNELGKQFGHKRR